jgi:hypothetical protein
MTKDEKNIINTVCKYMVLDDTFTMAHFINFAVSIGFKYKDASNALISEMKNKNSKLVLILKNNKYSNSKTKKSEIASEVIVSEVLQKNKEHIQKWIDAEFDKKLEELVQKYVTNEFNQEILPVLVQHIDNQNAKTQKRNTESIKNGILKILTDAIVKLNPPTEISSNED